MKAPVVEFMGVQIYIDAENGSFSASIEKHKIEEHSLRETKDNIENYLKAKERNSREKLALPVLIVSASNYGPPKALGKGSLTGLHGGTSRILYSPHSKLDHIEFYAEHPKTKALIDRHIELEVELVTIRRKLFSVEIESFDYSDRKASVDALYEKLKLRHAKALAAADKL